MNLHKLVKDTERRTREYLDRYIEELRELCAIDSDSYHKPGLDTMAACLAERMRTLEMKVDIVERETGGNDVLGVLRGDGGGNILLLGHTDTVYPVGTAAGRPLRMDGDRLYGPGTSDMKGGILSAIYTVEALLMSGFRSFGELRLLWVSDEEIPQRHSVELIRLVSQDCQGALVLEAARENGDIVSARKGNATYTLSARGRSAHAGVEPEKGHNAIIELAHQLLRFQSFNGWREGVTINAGVIHGGTVPNVVPDHAEVRFDLRFLHSADRFATEERWREMMNWQSIPEVELTLTSELECKAPLVCTPESLKMVRHARHLAEMLGFSLRHVQTGGASDANHLSSFGIPTLDGLGPVGGLDHSPDEYLSISSVPQRAAIVAGLIAIIGLGN